MARLSPKDLELEITERLLIQDTETTVAQISTLRGLGVRFSNDDFGTGYSSPACLKDLPIQKLKIDQSFIQDLAKEDGTYTLVRAILAMVTTPWHAGRR